MMDTFGADWFSWLAKTLTGEGKHDWAEGQCREMLRLFKTKYGDTDSRTLSYMRDLACCLSDSHEHEEFNWLFQFLLYRCAEDRGRNHPRTTTAILFLQGRCVSCEDLMRLKNLIKGSIILGERRSMTPLMTPRTGIPRYCISPRPSENTAETKKSRE